MDFRSQKYPELRSEPQMPRDNVLFPPRVSRDTGGSFTYFLSSCTELGFLISIRAQPNFWRSKETSRMWGRYDYIGNGFGQRVWGSQLAKEEPDAWVLSQCILIQRGGVGLVPFCASVSSFVVSSHMSKVKPLKLCREQRGERFLCEWELDR